MPRVSVILPTYNGAPFLRPQIDSILAQTDSDLELLVIDDGSSDETVAIVDDYAARDARVRRLPSSGNRGQNRRLVELVQAARGDFLAIADQDDRWAPDRNERLLAAVGDRAIACGRSQLIDGSGADLGLSILQAKGVDAAMVGPLTALFEPLVSAHAAIFRRDWIDVASFYGALPFDLALGLEAFFSTGLIYVDEALVFHRIHGGNQMNGAVVADAAGPPRFSPYRLRASLGHVRSRRIAFHRTLDQLGRSVVVPTEVRRAFAHLAATCWNVWFGIGGTPRSLEAEFHRLLLPHASSKQDRDVFVQGIRSLTRSRIAPVNLAAAWRHYRGATS